MIAFTESNRHLIPAKRDRHLQNDRASSEKAIAPPIPSPQKAIANCGINNYI